MLFHPPILYLGYVGFTVPFAFAIAALVTGRVGEGWLVETRRWALFSWGFLTVGILLGGWWSYEVLGWSGVWAWDPVENASFLPWLTGTAYIHSVLVQERRGMLRVWNLTLLVATFSLTILGTYLTRSGLLTSVHAFGDGPVGNYLLVFFGIVVGVSLALIGWRGDRLRSPGAIDSPVSREGAFLANNVLFTVFAFVVLLGTVFPLLVEALQDRRTVVGAPYFDRLSTPIGIALLFLMAVAPVLPWRKASSELLRDRLFWPAWCGAARSSSPCSRGDRLWPLLAFGLAGFAAGSARPPGGAGDPPPGLAGPRRTGQRRHDRAPRRHRDRRRPRRVEQLHPLGDDGAEVGEERAFAGHTFELQEVRETRTPGRGRRADVLVDGGASTPRRPRRTSGRASTCHAERAHRPGEDIYLTLEPGATPGDRGDDPRVRQAADPVAVDRRRDDGRRHGAGRVPRPPPAAPDRSRVGADRRRAGARSSRR